MDYDALFDNMVRKMPKKMKKKRKKTTENLDQFYEMKNGIQEYYFSILPFSIAGAFEQKLNYLPNKFSFILKVTCYTNEWQGIIEKRH